MTARERVDPKLASRELKRELALQAIVLFGFVALLWGLELFDQLVFAGRLDGLGIRPRSLLGLRGVLLAPLLHGDFDHLAANTPPLLLLGWLVMLRDVRHFFVVGFLATVVGGLGVWLVGSASSVHIGASILIFGLFGYLVLRGWFDGKVLSILGSFAVAVLWGSLFFGVLPGQPGISWEGHLFGFCGGALAARLLRQRPSALGARAAQPA